jgi:hypothetical protein
VPVRALEEHPLEFGCERAPLGAGMDPEEHSLEFGCERAPLGAGQVHGGALPEVRVRALSPERRSGPRGSTSWSSVARGGPWLLVRDLE